LAVLDPVPVVGSPPIGQCHLVGVENAVDGGVPVAVHGHLPAAGVGGGDSRGEFRGL